MSKEIERRIETAKPYSITWYCNFAKVGDKSKMKIHVGYCDYGKGIAFIDSDGISPIPRWLLIRDVYVSEANGLFLCEDAQCCFNLDCKLNRVNVSKLPKVFGLTKIIQVKRIHNLLAEASKKLELKTKTMGTILNYQETPVVWHILTKPKQHEGVKE